MIANKTREQLFQRFLDGVRYLTSGVVERGPNREGGSVMLERKSGVDLNSSDAEKKAVSQ
jgi:hypothetical protein